MHVCIPTLHRQMMLETETIGTCLRCQCHYRAVKSVYDRISSGIRSNKIRYRVKTNHPQNNYGWIQEWQDSLEILKFRKLENDWNTY